eukprot:TRINITY_DN9780_c0_g2_i12.p1 TRINITY_DN9780_c0_g2~~TRINITY_DN9780_c0_g2_i12.p1  ORF type:complete len:267 (-),score=66.91 TRINITY_DN9780_c0_g2_i12:335-1135(-)
MLKASIASPNCETIPTFQILKQLSNAMGAIADYLRQDSVKGAVAIVLTVMVFSVVISLLWTEFGTYQGSAVAVVLAVVAIYNVEVERGAEEEQEVAETEILKGWAQRTFMRRKRFMMRAQHKRDVLEEPSEESMDTAEVEAEEEAWIKSRFSSLMEQLDDRLDQENAINLAAADGLGEFALKVESDSGLAALRQEAMEAAHASAQLLKIRKLRKQLKELEEDDENVDFTELLRGAEPSLKAEGIASWQSCCAALLECVVEHTGHNA